MPTNVHVKSWMPQNDILGHPNTKLFISHCGLLSTQEALWFGIPVLSFPIFDDQFQNAARLKRMQVDETLSIINFTENELYETIKKLLEDPKYQTNMKKISNALRDQLMTPLETATYWTEWVLRHPEVDLKTTSTELSMFSRHSFDVYTLFLLLTFIVIWVQIKVIKLVIRLGSPKNKKKSTEKSKKNN